VSWPLLLALASVSPEPEAPPPRQATTVRAAGDAAVGWLEGLPLWLGGVGLEIGSQRGTVAIAVGPHYARGELGPGLAMQTLHLRGAVEWALGERFRIGIGGRTGFTWIQRATNDRWMDGMSLGAAPQLSFDLIRLPEGDSLFLRASPAADLFLEGGDDEGDAAMTLPSLELTLGYRWDETPE